MFANLLGPEVNVGGIEYIRHGNRQCGYCVTSGETCEEPEVRLGLAGQGD